MTEKLYYIDAYIRDFTATVTDCIPAADGWDVVLSSTAFFPEEGGQASDSGNINGIAVTHVREADGVIYHRMEEPMEVGAVVTGAIDFDVRFDKMQCHTAEHILSGIFHREYGLDNVGFHLGARDVTFDVSGYVDRAILDRVEELANRAVFENRAVRAFFPDPTRAEALCYRSKLEITHDLRLVEIEGVDLCACCAPHVAKTGEVGLIKLLDFEKHRGGTRIHMTAGGRALVDYKERYIGTQKISALLCVPQSEVADGVSELLAECDRLRYEAKMARMSAAHFAQQSISERAGNAVLYYPDMNMEQLREVANGAVGRVSGMLVLLSGVDGDLKYVIASGSANLSGLARDINSALSGRGGGRPEMIQGSFATSVDAVREYFEKP